MKRHTGIRSVAVLSLGVAPAGALAAGCAAPVRMSPRAATPVAQDTEPKAYSFACADGKSFEVVFGPQSATVSFEGATQTLAQQVSASGVRYANDAWEFRGKGEEGMLLNAKTGDTLAGDCRGAPTEAGAITGAVAGQQNGAAPVTLSGILTGTIVYRQRIALDPDAVIQVQLQDIARADAPATIVATQTITAAGRQVPIPFELTYDPGAIAPQGRYAVAARITLNGKLIWISTTIYPVLMGDSPTTGVEVLVEPVSQ